MKSGKDENSREVTERSSKNGKKTRNRIAASLTAVVAAAGMLMGSLFSSPAEIMQGNQLVPPDDHRPAIVQMIAEPVMDEVEEEEDGDEEKKKGWKAVVRAWILGLPALVRGLLLVPLWALGYALIAAVSAIWAPFLQPVLGTVLKWLLIAGVIALLVVGGVKAVAPEVPLKKILNKKTILIFIASSVVLCTLDAALPFYIEKYENYRTIACFLGGTVLLLGIVIARESRKAWKEGSAAKK